MNILKQFAMTTVVIFLTLTAALSFATTIPARPTNYVNDYAHLFSASQAASPNQSLKQLEDSTSNQVVIATFDTLNRQPLDEFSIKLAE